MELYRYTDHNHGTYAFIRLNKYEVSRETKHCYVLNDYGKERFVLKSQDGKRYAYTTLEGAQRGFIMRKRRQQMHVKNYMAHVDAVCARIDAGNAFDENWTPRELAGFDFA